MIDATAEQVITLGDARQHLPLGLGGQPVSLRTIARYAIRGVRGVKLETVRGGRVRVTTVEACQRFLEALERAEQRASRPEPPTRRERAARTRGQEARLARASACLRAQGI